MAKLSWGLGVWKNKRTCGRIPASDVMLNNFDDLMEALSAGDSIGLERLYYENLQDDMAPDLVLAHLELMREAGETIPASVLAL